VAQQARATSERDAQRARAALGFLTDAFSAAAPDNALSTSVSVRGLLDQARAQLDAQTLDPAIARSMQRLLGSLYDALGETGIATDLFKRGLADARPGDRAEALALALDYDRYANLLGNNDHYADARAALQKAADLRSTYAPDDADEQARNLVSLAALHHNEGEDAKAIPLLKQIVERPAGAAPLPAPLVIHATQSLASLLSSNGDCEASLKVAEDGLARVADRSPNAPDRLLLLREEAAAHRSCGRAAQSERLLRTIIEQQRQVTGSGGLAMAQLDNELALTLKDLGRFREAAQILQRTRLPGDGSPFNEAVVFSNLASALEDAGDYAQAMQFHARAREALDRERIDADSDVRRRAARNEARTLAMIGQAGRAVSMLEDLRARAGRIDGEDSFEYAMVTWQLALAERRAQRLDGALRLAEDTELLWSKLVPPTHKIFAYVHRLRAAVALTRDQLDVAEREFAAALATLQANSAPPVDLATVHSEQAELRRRQGRRDEARDLLASALPVMREAFLPEQLWRADAERTAAQLGMR